MSHYGLSRSYDENDEYPYQPESVTHDDGEIPDLFFRPDGSLRRPLPPPPLQSDSYHGYNEPAQETLMTSYHESGYQTQSHHIDRTNSSSRAVYHSGVDRTSSSIRQVHALGVDRVSSTARPVYNSNIFRSHSSTKPVYNILPGRMSSVARQVVGPGPAVSVVDHGRNRWTTPPFFDRAKLTEADFRRCQEPWALSGILSWLSMITDKWTLLHADQVCCAVAKLFESRMSGKPLSTRKAASTLANVVIIRLFKEGVLQVGQGSVLIKAESVSGVLTPITGAGCYSPRLHAFPCSTKCYSYSCSKPIKDLNTSTNEGHCGDHSSNHDKTDRSHNQIAASDKEELDPSSNSSEHDDDSEAAAGLAATQILGEDADR